MEGQWRATNTLRVLVSTKYRLGGGGSYRSSAPHRCDATPHSRRTAFTFPTNKRKEKRRERKGRKEGRINDDESCVEDIVHVNSN